MMEMGITCIFTQTKNDLASCPSAISHSNRRVCYRNFIWFCIFREEEKAPATFYIVTDIPKNGTSGSCRIIRGVMSIPAAGTGMVRYGGRDIRFIEIACGSFLLGFLFFGDIVSTEYILLMGGHELNWFMVPFVSDPVLHALVKLFVLCLVTLAAIVCNRTVRGSGSALLIVVLALYSVVVASNLRMILQMMFCSLPAG